MAAGKLTEETVYGGAGHCAKTYGIPLPEMLSPSVLPSYAKAAAPVRQSVATPAPPPVNTACDNASSRYVKILHDMSGRLSAAGPRMVDMCDDNGRMCGVMHQNSKYYYTLGQICDSLTVAERDIRNSCPASEVPAPLDQCR
jgi:hypothetical protein